ncbi:MAG: potassium transporter Kup [bacterium]|nr:potassium transporter Kup [bacterium]
MADNAPQAATHASHGGKSQRRDLLPLSLAALGIVYGDIGTSPIYAIRESFHHSHGISLNPDNIMGVLSLIFWSLVIVISIKYLALVMRADNHGEGGIIALIALVAPSSDHQVRGARKLLTMIGLFGAALLYGDSIITPAISVLSAVEGLEVVTPFFAPYVIPITIAILFVLFVLQQRGTAGIGAMFGPVTLLWFITLGLLGLAQIIRHPSVVAALNPLYAISFFAHNHWRGFLALGSVFLVVTGGEALYADMGHFGRRPIRLAWFVLVLPALLLNYFGQGALLLTNPKAIEHPFFLMAPSWLLFPLVILTTVATVIASQAVISGAFSLTRQAIQLGYLPRMEIRHTSAKQIGQIYLPTVNWALMLACIGLVVGFRTSSNLAAAYGVAVTTDMVFTTLLFAVVARTIWKWRLATTLLLSAALLIVDIGFWGANLPKVPHGGWFPLVIAGLMFTLMTTWKKGRQILAERIRERVVSVDDFLAQIRTTPPLRVPGTAIYMYSNSHGMPPALINNLQHNKVLHERVISLIVRTQEIPYVAAQDRVQIEFLGEHIYRLTANYGFAENPNVPALLKTTQIDGQGFDLSTTSFFLGKEQLLATKRPGMALWRERLFSRTSRNALGATAFFHVPSERVVEFGTQIEL